MSKKGINYIWQYARNYRWKSLFFSYFTVLLIATTIPFGLFSITAYHYYYSTIQNEISNSAMRSLANDGTNIDNFFSNVDINSSIISSNAHVLSYLSLPHKSTDKFLMSNISSRVAELIMTYLSSNECINSVSLFSISNHFVYSTYDGGNYDDISDKVAFEIYEKTGNGNYIFSRVVLSLQNHTEHYITVCREIRYGSSLEGLLLINIDAKKFGKLLSTSGRTSDENIYVVDNNGLILYSNNLEKMGEKISEAQHLHSAYENATDDGYVKTEKNRNMHSSLRTSKTSWTIVKDMSLDTFADRDNTVKIIGILVGIATIICSLALAFFISLHFYRSLIDIIAILQNPNDRSFSRKDKEGNEILYIMRNILEVIDNNSKTEQELAYRLSMLRKSQSIALQTQINPHFLFNTLQLANMITISKLKDDNEVTHILSLLSDLVRTALETKETLVSVKSEIEYAKKYLEIQNIRYRNRFNATWHIDDNTLDLKTIKLVLQPLIENSISHGIIPMECPRNMTISSSISNKSLVLSVSDNGIGMSAQRLNEVRRLISLEYIKEDQNIGLCNVNQRIRLIFGNNYGVYIDSDRQGTKVTLKMPIMQEP